MGDYYGAAYVRAMKTPGVLFLFPFYLVISIQKPEEPSDKTRRCSFASQLTPILLLAKHRLGLDSCADAASRIHKYYVVARPVSTAHAPMYIYNWELVGLMEGSDGKLHSGNRTLGALPLLLWQGAPPKNSPSFAGGRPCVSHGVSFGCQLCLQSLDRFMNEDCSVKFPQHFLNRPSALISSSISP